jgi:lipoprotein-anchoring transpeptidase ErfK/SrfK
MNFPKHFSSLIFSFFSILLLFAFSGVGFFAYNASQEVIVSLDQYENISLSQTLRITFSHSMRDEGYREKILLSPKTNAYVSWTADFKTIEISPQSIWKPETQYTITLPETKTVSWASFEETQLFFQTSTYPNVATIRPENGEKNVIVGVEDPLIVELDKGAGEYWIDFAINPQKSVVFQSNDERSRFEILPKEIFENGSQYDITVSAYPKNSVDSKYRKVLKTFSFETLPPAPTDWSKDLTERVGQAKRFTQAQILEGKYIDINIDAQIMTIFENGVLLDSYLISSGLRGMDTPKGSFQIHNKHPRPWSKQYSLFMPFWMAITPDGKYGIHELPEWPGGYKEGANHLGIPVSHGCVRLGVGSASRVYEWAEIGIPVIIY